MTTLSEVAKRAGVSIATVSKVLSNTPYFTEETRQRVMQAVEELGYVPNLAARALAAGKTQIIGVVFPYIYDTVFTDPLVQHMLQGIEAECTQRHYNMLLSTPRVTDEKLDEPYLRLLGSGYLDGVVALDNVPTTSVLAPARERNLAAVSIGYGDHPYYVRSDDWHGGQVSMAHLLELGHRHIGVIGVPEALNTAINGRLRGYAAACDAAGVDYATLPKADGDFSMLSGARSTQQLLSQHPDLTALICVNDRMALGAIQQAQAMGHSVPQSLSVVGYDDIPAARMFAPALTTVNQHAPLLGHKAMQMLFRLMAGEPVEPLVMVTDLVVRDSTAAPTSL